MVLAQFPTLNEFFDFLESDFSLFGITIQYWTIIALALLVACIAAWLFSKKI
jgi:hypothetical protein